ncbi:hypothetical protein Q73_07935 [Bacillus coahuilensis m2-6]|uniref:YppG family protein n=1 Tax=Bacillus coahuilensis TaxID=408580 RepID=UPI00075037D5|nr:YppG family protein [Bacillus coahuilensis]KUP08021.1 hypothetical protein Q73_07935 [Bacillus coahuilensis m2-6]
MMTRRPSYYPSPAMFTYNRPVNYPMQFYNGGYQPPIPYTQANGYSQYANQQSYTYPTGQSYFQNPLQAEEYHYFPKQVQTQNLPAYQNPYPKGSFLMDKGKGNTIMNSFKNQEGQFDFNKVMNTTGQLMGAVNQMSAVVKGIGSMFLK